MQHQDNTANAAVSQQSDGHAQPFQPDSEVQYLNVSNQPQTQHSTSVLIRHRLSCSTTPLAQAQHKSSSQLHMLHSMSDQSPA